MEHRSKLLKVMSIIFIVFGGIGLLTSFGSIFSPGILETAHTAMGLPAPTTIDFIMPFISSSVALAAGIIGISSKSKQVILIVGILLLGSDVFNIVQTGLNVGFSAFSLFGLALPILYVWGWYQSN